MLNHQGQPVRQVCSQASSSKPTIEIQSDFTLERHLEALYSPSNRLLGESTAFRPRLEAGLRPVQPIILNLPQLIFNQDLYIRSIGPTLLAPIDIKVNFRKSYDGLIFVRKTSALILD